MTFLDDEVRDAFHKIGTLMQIVVSILEFEAAKYHGQLELIGCENDTALVAAHSMSTDDMYAVCEAINRQFKRSDKRFTAFVHDTTLRTIQCFVTSHKDLEEVH